MAEGYVTFDTADLVWTEELVKYRLRVAARLIERYVQSPRPAGFKSAMPQPDEEWSPRVVDHAAILSEIKRKADLQLAGGSYTDRDISRAEQALLWPMRYMAADDIERPRRALSLWLWCVANDRPWSRHYAELGCSKASADRWRARAFEIILDGLVGDGVTP